MLFLIILVINRFLAINRLLFDIGFIGREIKT
jgi:hypothetical protein